MRSSHNEQVLVVDDDDTSRFLISSALQEAGFNVSEAVDGQHATELLESVYPHIILSDISMPRLDGYQLCRWVRQQKTIRDLPVVLVTGMEDIESVHKAYDSGATDFITKPINYTLLIYRVRYLLRATDNTLALREQSSKLHWSQNVAHMGYWEILGEDRELKISKEVYTLFDISPATQPLGNIAEWLGLVHKDDRDAVSNILQTAIDYQRPFNINHRVTTPAGRELIVNLQARSEPVIGQPGKTKLRGLVQDITAQKKASEQIYYLKMYDSITGLPNRELFGKYCHQALAYANRHSLMAAIFCIDIDRYRRITETLGSAASDLILKEVALRIQTTIRDCDCASVDQDQNYPAISRDTDNIFYLLVNCINTVQDCRRIAQRIQQAFDNTFSVDAHEVVLTANIGVSVYPMDGDNTNILLQNANAAMTHARKTQPGSFQYYSPSVNASSLKKLKLEHRLHKAVENNRIEAYYQPQIGAHSQALLGMEALARWHDEELGWISPAEFIPLAEETGLIIPLTELILEQACQDTQRWSETYHLPLRVGINLSNQHMQDLSFHGVLAQILHDTQLKPHQVELELTEGGLVQNADTTIQIMHQLKDMGVKLSIDDFGTGYSSLNYLAKFPLDTLKIDQSFVRHLDSNPDNKKIVFIITKLAHSLNLNVIVEGVETATELQLLREYHCDEIQGYFYSKPLSRQDFEQFIINKGHLGKALQPTAPNHVLFETTQDIEILLNGL